MRPSADEIYMILQRERIPATVVYDTVKSTTSRIYGISAHVLEYISYWLSISVVFTLKYILGLSIFVSSGIKEHKNGALKVVDVAIFSQFDFFVVPFRSERALDYISNMIWCLRFCKKTN